MAETSGKILMVYYSFEGNIEYVSRIVQEELGADLLRLEPDMEPPRKGLGKFLTGGRDALMKRYPKLTESKYNLSDYDQMILASPVWAGTYTPAIGAFLRDNKFQGKRIYLIASSSGGNAEKMLLRLEDDLKGNNVVETLSLKDPLHNESIELPKIQNFCHRIAN